VTVDVNVPPQLSVAEELARAAASALGTSGYQGLMGPELVAVGGVVSVLVVYVKALDTLPHGSLKVMVMMRTQSSPVLLTLDVSVPGQLSVADELARASEMAAARLGYQGLIGPKLVATGGVVSVLVE
jgi:hypothetical protein